MGVLCDFAAAGHQVLVFTCHEHMLRLFKSLHTPVGRLPDSRDTAPAAIVFEEPASEKSGAQSSFIVRVRCAAARLAAPEPEEDAGYDEDEQSDESADRGEGPYEEGGSAEAA